MRALVAIYALAAVLLVGCDPAGLRRVQLRLPSPPIQTDSIEIDQPDVQEALGILDTVVTPLGFKLSREQSDHSYVRAYRLSRLPAVVEGRSYSRDVPIRVT